MNVRHNQKHALKFMFLLYLMIPALVAALSFYTDQAHAQSSADALTPDGGRYYGSLLDGKLHGQGRLEWDNGARYAGGFEHGLYSGQGQYQSASGHIYQGGYSKGMMDGHGRYVHPDGSVYVGEFHNDDFSGQGRHETLNGYVYEGAFENGQYNGKGRLIGPDEEYQGDFKNGQFSGHGTLKYADGRKYDGEFAQNQYHGKGRLVSPDGEIYEGDFDKGEFTGNGIHKSARGALHKGRFVKWRPHGSGTFTDANGNIYEGSFTDGLLNGSGLMTGKDGSRYEGEFKDWKYHGQGVYRYGNGDEYKGSFAYGLFDGEGKYIYAVPQKDGRTQKTGIWRYGMLEDKDAEKQIRINVENALYSQSSLLANELAKLKARERDQINLYLLAIGGDGKQEVFRRETEFVKQQFDREFGTQGRSLVLVNSRSTVTRLPMATITSIRESLKGIAARMDKDKDILFLFLTSHGSKEHELTLSQDGMDLRDLSAKELGSLLKEAGIRWKVVVVSACYSGGFIAPLKDDHTMVITASRHDRTSFGCKDENDFTYFGKAFFNDSLSKSKSFDEAFAKAKVLVREQEAKDFAGDSEKSENDHSEPQIHSPHLIKQYLRRWSAQLKPSISTHAQQGAAMAPPNR